MGSSSQTQKVSNTNQTAAPWQAAQPALQGLLNTIQPQIANTGLTGNENSAISGLTANANAGNPYASQIGGAANNLLGGGQDFSGYVTGAYNNLQSSLSPYTTMDTNPYSNPAFVNATNTLTNDITDRIKSQYAGAGYSPVTSGDFAQQLGRGISQGVAPTWLQGYNDLTNQKLGAINSLYGAGNATAGALSGLQQTSFGNQQQGINAASSALAAQNQPYMAALQAEAMRRGIPLENLQGLSNLIVPMAKLGGTVQGQGTESVTTPTPWTTYAGLGLAGLGTAAQFMSDRNEKTDIKKIGDDEATGLPLYSYRYKGDPKTYPKVVGPMAQDVEKAFPGSTERIGGKLTIKFGIAGL